MHSKRNPNNSSYRPSDDLELRNPSAPLTDHCDKKPLQNGSLEEDANEEDSRKQHVTVEEQHSLEEEKQRQKKKYTRLSRLRRRRCAHKDARGEDESDLSEGFESEEDDDDDDERRAGSDPAGGATERASENPAPMRKGQKRDHLGEEGGWARSSEEEEEDDGGTAFDVETDSDMNSQESRSDLEDMEEGDNSMEAHGREQRGYEAEHKGRPKGERADRDTDTPPTSNGPLLPADSSISSNLQAMSSQLFQAKRCFRLAPTFSNMLLRPQASSSSATPTDTSTPPPQESPPPFGESLSDVNPATANGTTENGTVLHISV